MATRKRQTATKKQGGRGWYSREKGAGLGGGNIQDAKEELGK